MGARYKKLNHLTNNTVHQIILVIGCALQGISDISFTLGILRTQKHQGAPNNVDYRVLKILVSLQENNPINTKVLQIILKIECTLQQGAIIFQNIQSLKQFSKYGVLYNRVYQIILVIRYIRYQFHPRNSIILQTLGCTK